MATRRIDRVDLRFRNAEDPGGHHAVDVVIEREGPAEGRVAREVGQDPQLDLRIVGCQEPPALPGHEGLADLLALLGAHRNVLQVGVAGAQPSRGRHALVERGMDPAVLGMDQGRQRIEISALELRELAMLQEQGGQRVPGGQLLEDVLRGALLAAGRLLRRGQLELLEEHLAELGAGVDVERPASQPVDVVLERCQPPGELDAKARPAAACRPSTPTCSIPARIEIKGRSTSVYSFQSPCDLTLGARISSIRQVASASSPA